MYLVSDEYKTKIQELDRVFSIEIRIEHKDGTLILGDKELAQGSFNFFDGSQASDEFTVGGTVASHLEFTLVNKELYDDISFIGARVVPTIKFMLREGVQAHFLQPSQPSKMRGSDEGWENIPLGQFNIDIADRKRTTIDIKAIDNMINLDIPYSLSTLSYPASLWQIYVDICNVTDVTVGNTSFPNQGYMVQEKPVGDLTFRNVLGFVAELSGTFSKFNRIGELELRWYRETGVILTSKHRSSLEMSDFQIQITGVSVETDDKDVNDNPISYITGTDDYAIDLTGNELLQGNYASVLPDLLGNIEDTIFTPYTANFHGNPALESGDIITHIDVDGNVFKTLITHSKYKYRGTSVLDAKGLPNISRGFNSTDGRIAQIIKKVDKEIGNKLTTLEQEQLNATELIGNMLGGYVTEIKYEDDPNFARFGIGVFIHDQKLLANSNKLWKWGIGGFGYSENGGVTYTTGVTASGSIVAELVSANIITADMVKTGILQSLIGNSFFNLDTGVLRISHGGTEYTQADINGFGRKHTYGNSVSYLSDIFFYRGGYVASGEEFLTNPPPTERVPLPQSWRGRRLKATVFLSVSDSKIFPQYSGSMTSFIRTVLDYDDTGINAVNPYIDVDGYVETYYRLSGWADYESRFTGLKWQLILVGE